MPLVRISLRAGTSPADQRAIADGVHEAMVSAIGIPAKDRFQIIDERPAESMIFDPSYLGVHRQSVVCVQITLARGRPAELKQSLYRAVADNLEKTGVRREDVFTVLYETGREDWSVGNGEAQLLDEELLKRHGWTPPAR
ncbi:MAG TPA: tautomerase family protein [Pseudonocardiaceae bacterium]|jgi:phenylpyruvate tautomerase PptA (4-oxalocrotonate tautomerase family)|nr:tautomerase family protein [Pseudonocardiaceae bacterium]